MIALELTNIKDFMNKLLLTDTFDHFLLQEASITGGATYLIDGHISQGYYTEEELEELHLEGLSILPYALLRGKCFDLLKGRKTPSSFKFIFLLSPSNLENTLHSLDTVFTPQDITGIFLNIRYQNQLLTLTTGISYAVFSTDRSLETDWDQLVQKFLSQKGIAWEKI